MALDLDNLPDNVDREGVEAIRGISVAIGRAITFSCIVATCHSDAELEAIAEAEQAWTDLADKIIEFAVSD